jgi:hypothetical protein
MMSAIGFYNSKSARLVKKYIQTYYGYMTFKNENISEMLGLDSGKYKGIEIFPIVNRSCYQFTKERDYNLIIAVSKTMIEKHLGIMAAIDLLGIKYFQYHGAMKVFRKLDNQKYRHLTHWEIADLPFCFDPAYKYRLMPDKDNRLLEQKNHYAGFEHFRIENTYIRNEQTQFLDRMEEYGHPVRHLYRNEWRIEAAKIYHPLYRNSRPIEHINYFID